ncbi:hypothetical protein TWF506_005261 [Arthrobotrys conoides]|uniref:Uncharacterized protein n=1 Tax=Arthrobotrys conoides TaxID=74498 RepID=A0AAN8NNW5_9PEZI
MVTRAAVFTLLMLSAYPVHSFKISFHDPPIPGGPLDYTDYSGKSYECYPIPQNERTGEQKVDDIVVQTESTAIVPIGFYAVSNNPQDAPCAKQNLQIVALFPRNSRKDMEQYFTPIWPRLSYWRRLQPGYDDWVLLGRRMEPGDVLNRSGSGWLTEKSEIQTRRAQDVDPEPYRIIQQNTPAAPQQGLNLPTMEPTKPPEELELMVKQQLQQDFRPKSQVLDPKVLRDQIFELAAHYKTQALKANPDLKIDLAELEPLLPEITALQQYKDDLFVDRLNPSEYTDYVSDIAKIQRTVGQKNGYMPVPPALRHRFSGQKLNRLGFNVIPKEELRNEFAQQRNPHSYFRRFAGMGRNSLIGEIVPSTYDWKENGGMMSLNPQVQSPRRVQIVETDEGETKVQDNTDLNGELRKTFTQEELRAASGN